MSLDQMLAQQAGSSGTPSADPLDQMLAQQAAARPAAAKAAPQPPTQPQVSTWADMLHSVPGGLAKGVAGLAGLPRDASDLLDAGVSKIGNMISPGSGDRLVDFSHNATLGRKLLGPAPSSAQINKAISAPFGGYYKPQTVPGEYAETISSFVPNAIAPGSIGQRVARVLVPGAASETAGQATKGTELEPYARTMGALLGGVAEGAGEGAIARAANPAPTLEELGRARTAAYRAADQEGVVISPESFQRFATDVGTNLTRDHVVQADLHPNTLAALDIIQQEAAAGAPISLERADAIRQAVRDAASGATPADARLVGRVREAVDHYLDNLAPTDTISGDASVAVPILREARSIAQREFKGRKIQEMMDLAENSASTHYSASGYEQALRVQFKNLNAQLIKNRALANTYTPEERDAIRAVAEGGPIGNALRWLGKFSAHGPVSAAAGASLGAMFGHGMGHGAAEGGMVGAVALPAVAEAARAGATSITARNAGLAAELMRRGAPAANGAPRTAQTALGSLLLSHGAHP